LMALGGGLVVAFPDVVNQYLLGQPSGTAPARPVLIQQTFTAENIEVIVPTGTNAQALREAFIKAFTVAAQGQHPGATINPNAPPSYIGDPQKIDDEASGTKYRATM